MPNFNAQADVYCAVGPRVPKFHPLPRPKPIYSGSVAQCREWVMNHHQGYPALFSIRVPWEAGFQTDELHYPEIEGLSKHPDFPH